VKKGAVLAGSLEISSSRCPDRAFRRAAASAAPVFGRAAGLAAPGCCFARMLRLVLVILRHVVRIHVNLQIVEI
jgi:hypothetical protein